jgi:hypothetical protein
MVGRIDVTRKWLANGTVQSFIEDLSVTLESLPPLPVIFLVGDPGSGKTDTVKAHVDALPTGRTRELFSEVSSRSQVESWLVAAFNSSSELFLDAYDERSGQFRRDYLLEPLVKALAENRCPRTRIVSRGTHLPESLVEEIRRIEAPDSNEPLVFRIEPLTDAQIRHWASTCLGQSVESFFAEIRADQLEQYLGRPVDLQAFINAFKSKGTLGNSPTAAWLEAIRFELTETNPDRQDQQGDLAMQSDVEDRFRLATVLGVSQSLCDPVPILVDGITALDAGPGITSGLLWEQTRHLFPGMNQIAFKVLLRETVQSRLFELGKDGISFASAAKAQFLAAQFLVDGNPDQIISLLKDRLQGHRIPERAQPIAAEVGKFVPQLFDWICRNQPESLLRGVVLDFSPTQRSQLVAALLERGEKRDPHFHGGPILGSLAHPGLVGQLRPYLNGKSGDDNDLNLAIDIAEYTICRPLAKELAAIATSSRRNLGSRVNAAHALARMGGKEVELLRPLLSLSRTEDKDDELFACALIGLWPQGFALDEAFRILREPQEVNGLYHGFLSYYYDGIQHRIGPQHLIPGLRWLATRQRKPSAIIDDFDRLAWALTKLAWVNLEQPGVAEGLARVVQARVRGFSNAVLPFRERPILRGATLQPGLDPEDYESDRDRRWILFRAWLTLPVKGRSSWEVARFVRAAELEDLIALATTRRGANREILVDAVIQFTCVHIRERDRSALNRLGPKLGMIGIELDDLRRRIRDVDKRHRRYRRPKVRDGFRAEAHGAVVSDFLNRADPKSFPRFLEAFRLERNGWGNSNAFGVSRWQRWLDAGDQDRRRVALLVKGFLALGPSSPRPKQRLSLSGWDWAGLAGLLLLSEIDTEWLAENFAVVRLWLPFLSCRRNHMDIQRHPAFKLFEHLSNAETMLEIQEQINLRLADDPNPLDMDRLDELWREDVGYLLAETSRKWSMQSRQALITVLVLQGHPKAATELRKELKSKAVARRSFAVRLSLTFGFSIVYPDISQTALLDPEVYEQVWSLLWECPRVNSESSVELFDLALRIRFFERAVTKAPVSEDVESRGGRITSEMNRQRLRDSLAASVAKTYSKDALAFVREWSIRPGFDWLKQVARKAEYDYIEGSWTPPALGVILKLTQDPARRFIATQRDLHDAVRYALQIVQPHAETQTVYWKDITARKPADEPAITQNLALLLAPHLSNMIVNAEVSCLGGRTDIQVEANETAMFREPQRLKCVIEAKHCSNPGLETSIGGQLVQTYLPSQFNQTGIYLVFWSCPREGCHCRQQEAIKGLLQEQADKAGTFVSVVHFQMRTGGKNRGSSLRKVGDKASHGARIRH